MYLDSKINHVCQLPSCLSEALQEWERGESGMVRSFLNLWTFYYSSGGFGKTIFFLLCTSHLYFLKYIESASENASNLVSPTYSLWWLYHLPSRSRGMMRETTIKRFPIPDSLTAGAPLFSPESLITLPGASPPASFSSFDWPWFNTLKVWKLSLWDIIPDTYILWVMSFYQKSTWCKFWRAFPEAQLEFGGKKESERERMHSALISVVPQATWWFHQWARVCADQTVRASGGQTPN